MYGFDRLNVPYRSVITGLGAAMRAARPRGAHLPTLTEVEANLRAGAVSAGTSDLPDVLAWSDLCAAPELVHQRLVRRLREGRCPALAGNFPYPKAGKNEQRRMAFLDVYDDLYYRIITGRVAAALDAALNPDVMSYRLECGPPAWSCRDPKQAFLLRKQRGGELLADDRCAALMITDIRHYFPSITPQLLAAVLRHIGAPDGAVGLIEGFLRELETVGAPKGLPIGPEASGLLGNIAMLPIDDAVAPLVVGHVRYTDDSWLFLRWISDWRATLERYREAAASCGLDMNAAKIEIHAKADGSAARALQHERIAYLTSGDAGYRPPAWTAAEFRDRVNSEQPDWALCGFLLGSLRHHRHIGALGPIYENPAVLRELPRQVGAYLKVLAADKQARRAIDRDWLIQHVASSHTPRELAGQLQVCRAARWLRLSKAHGKRMEQMATDSDLHRHVPLRTWAATAWGSSRAHKPARAIEYACEFGDFSVRRAFAATIPPDASTHRHRSRWRRQLLAVDADLLPVAERLR